MRMHLKAKNSIREREKKKGLKRGKIIVKERRRGKFTLSLNGGPNKAQGEGIGQKKRTESAGWRGGENESGRSGQTMGTQKQGESSFRRRADQGIVTGWGKNRKNRLSIKKNGGPESRQTGEKGKPEDKAR